MAPKFAGKRRSSGAGSPAIPAPKMSKLQKTEVSMTVTALPYGSVGRYVHDTFSDTPLTLFVLDVNAAVTRVYDATPLFQGYLRAEAATSTEFPATLQDLANFGLLWSCQPKPQYFRLLYTDNGVEGFSNAWALLRGFLNYLATHPAHKSKLASLTVDVYNATEHSTEGFGTDSAVPIRICDPQSIDLHPCSLKHPDRRGHATLYLRQASEDITSGLEGALLAEYKADVPILVPQFMGYWWGLKTVLRDNGFEEDAGEDQKKIFQAPPVSTKSGAAWLESFINSLANTPLVVFLKPKLAPAFEALLDKPSIQHRALLEPAA